MLTSQPQLFPEIITTIRNLKPKNITAERKLILKPLIDFIQAKVESQQEIRLNFICTHNSRRSHLSQVWAQVMAYNFKINNLYCYSGGTEATALFPKVAETLQKSGLLIQNLSEQENPVYGIKYASNQHPIIGFSKKYDDAFNPTSNFAAIMTCSQADAGCPFIPVNSSTSSTMPQTYLLIATMLSIKWGLKLVMNKMKIINIGQTQA